MQPSKDEEDAVVDLLDVILRDGAVLDVDAIITVADVPLVGLKLRAALAGMDTMTRYGLFEEWDRRHRDRALDEDSGEREFGDRPDA